MRLLRAVRAPQAALRHYSTILGTRGIGQRQWVSRYGIRPQACSTSIGRGPWISRARPRGRAYSTNIGNGKMFHYLRLPHLHSQATETGPASNPSTEADQAPAPSMPDAELDAAPAPPKEADQILTSIMSDTTTVDAAPAPSTESGQVATPIMPDMAPDVASAPTVEAGQAPTSTIKTLVWRTWRDRRGTPGPSTEESDFSSLREEVRRAMRTMPHALAVVTSKTPNGVTKGLLVSSFNTVTLHRRAYVSFNIKLPSSTYDAIARSKRFTITAIWSTETAKAFANPNYSKLNPLPLEESDPRSLQVGGLFSLDCKWYRLKSVKIQDHVIMLGRVDTYHPGRPQNITKSPLVYVKGDYQTGPRSNS